MSKGEVDPGKYLPFIHATTFMFFQARDIMDKKSRHLLLYGLCLNFL